MTDTSILMVVVLSVCLLLAIGQVAVMVRVKRDLLERERTIYELRNELYALLRCGRGYAQRLKHQQHRLTHLSQRQESLEQRGSDNEACRMAVTMARRGASTRELIETCGLSRGEAELVARLHRTP
jgi:hypothetical protein